MAAPQWDLGERTFRFACDVVRLCARLEASGGVARRTAGQLFDAATSVGANYQESRNASSRRDLLRRQELVLRECREAHYWLRLVAACSLTDDPLNEVIHEADQLVAIFTASTKKIKSSPHASAPR